MKKIFELDYINMSNLCETHFFPTWWQIESRHSYLLALSNFLVNLNVLGLGAIYLIYASMFVLDLWRLLIFSK